MRRITFILAGLLLIPGVAHAGGGGVDTSGCPGYSEGATVSMLDSCFSGVAHFAPSDTTITVRNDGGLPHTLTAVDGSFDTGQVSAGASAQLSIDEPGVYRVFCALHGTAAGEGMAGVLVVGEATPAAVVSPIDTTAIRDAVAGENAAIVEAIEEQSSSLQSVTATHAKLLVALDQADGGEETMAGAVPVQLDVVDPERNAIMILVGLAAGLALAALLTALRLGMTSDRRRGLERLEPEIGS